MTVEETVEWVKNKPEVWKHKGRLESVDSIMVNDDTVFIRKNVYDTSGRVRLLRSANPNTTYYVIEAGDDNFSILQDFLGFSDFILSSTLPKPPKKSMKFKAKKHTSSYSHHRRSSAWDDGDDTELDIAVEETHYYVRLASNYAVVIDAVDAVGDKVEHQIDDFGKAVYLAMELDIIPRDMTIWGLNKTNTKLVADDDNWVEAWGYIVDKVKEYLDGIGKNDLIDNEEDLRRITNSFYYLGKKSFVGTFGQMNNAVGEFAREWESAVHQKSLAKFDPNMIGMITNLAFMCKIPFQRPTYQKSSLMVAYEKMNTEYPLMEYVNHGRMHLQDFKEYILALDNMKKASNI
jgi:hypothetical protein